MQKFITVNFKFSAAAPTYFNCGISGLSGLDEDFVTIRNVDNQIVGVLATREILSITEGMK